MAPMSGVMMPLLASVRLTTRTTASALAGGARVLVSLLGLMELYVQRRNFWKRSVSAASWESVIERTLVRTGSTLACLTVAGPAAPNTLVSFACGSGFPFSTSV
jgi:DNA-binding transcriptional regulator YdaS (Cro superfamily)